MDGRRGRNEAERCTAAHPLRHLLDPIAPEHFFETHYERTPLFVSRREPGRYADLLSLEAIDAFIDGSDLRVGMLDLVRDTGRIAAERYISPDGRVIPSAVAVEYLNGATIILPQLHESIPSLGKLCRAVEAEMSCHVQANAYLTPPGGRGFGVHFDHHDVLVLQVSGTKSWRLYANGPQAHSTEWALGPGDCLYVPRGLQHDASNVGNEPSLHVTLGLITKSWADLVIAAVADLALREPGLRRSLPPGFAGPGFDRGVARERLGALLHLIGEKADPEQVLDRLALDFLRERRPQVAGVIAGGAASLQAGGLFRIRPLLCCRLADDDGQLALIGPGTDLHFDRGDAEALTRALSGAPFGLQDLSCSDPARLLRRLWANGYLETAEHA
jgi:hypothetical protein